MIRKPFFVLLSVAPRTDCVAFAGGYNVLAVKFYNFYYKFFIFFHGQSLLINLRLSMPLRLCNNYRTRIRRLCTLRFLHKR